VPPGRRCSSGEDSSAEPPHLHCTLVRGDPIHQSICISTRPPACPPARLTLSAVSINSFCWVPLWAASWR
jgi:hypothetical protein